ncbi:hypothetical protein AY601_3527 [Pedobacter cryoconitis]|uniref:Uncharacterized protein n=1 Tax=Pedobacter cryoconitis TaxID=188932 RepID=A0A127VG89_9SPHI|nr:hypothetical protein [Pedobacter cryoconitis]AMQ00393.1 hypothetical protein AY601_3527 [Pedobacter cryoconitis]
MIRTTSLKISSFCIVTKTINEHKTPSFIFFNCKLKKWVVLDPLNKELIETGQFGKLNEGLLYELISSGILIHESQEEKSSLIERLKVFDRLTILVDENLDEQFINDLNAFTVLQGITQLAFLFTRGGDETTETVSIIKQAFNQNERLKKIRYFTLELSCHDHQYINLSEYKDDINPVPERVHLQQIITKRSSEAGFEKSDITQYSCYTYNEGFFSDNFSKINFIRNTYSLSLINSSCSYLKELPFSGLVCDSSRLKTITKQIEIHPDCKNCQLLVGCGGYATDQNIVCPSYKNTIQHSINNFVHIDNQPADEESPYFGVRNRVHIKQQVDLLLENLIKTNTAELNKPYINVIIEEYNQAFQLSKNNLTNLSVSCATEADKMASIFKEGSFEQDFIQTSCTSAKSYLEYRKKKYAESTQIIEKGLNHAVNLLLYPNSEIAFLVIYQMLTNKAKVALINKDFYNWKKYVLECIHLILNKEQPASCPAIDFSSFSSLSTPVLNAIVMETIERILLMNIKDPEFKHGPELILSIAVNNQDNLLNIQISSWVSIMRDFVNINEIYFSDNFHIFMSSANELISIKPLKLYLKSYLKKRNPELLKKLNTTR